MARRVLQSVRVAGIEGTYRVIHPYRQGRGKQVLAIIVMDGPVSVRTDLPEPRGADVIYLQGPDGWKTIPAQVRTVNRAILISPPRPEDDDLGHDLIFDASGSGSGFSIPRASR